MKRVICLYRVSTVGQVDHDDIPMQKLACREYAASHPDWEIVDEISEKGISGYKVSTNDRDAIVEIKKRAIMHKFDVLLVFMFDRIGRRDDETPFVVQWFVQQGIEVWSAREGEQRFDNHVDKLLNYIGLPIPDKLKAILEQLHDRKEKEHKEDETDQGDGE